MPDASQREASASAYSANGANSPQPDGSLEEHGLAHVDPAEAHPHGQGDDVRPREQLVGRGQRRHGPIMADRS